MGQREYKDFGNAVKTRKSTEIKIGFRLLSVPESRMFMADRDLGCDGVHTYVAT